MRNNEEKHTRSIVQINDSFANVSNTKVNVNCYLRIILHKPKNKSILGLIIDIIIIIITFVQYCHEPCYKIY